MSNPIAVKLINGEYLNFGGKCNQIDYIDKTFCRFKHVDDKGNTYRILAWIPYDRISYVIGEEVETK